MNTRAALASFSMALAVGLGALAAHFLATRLSPESLLSFQTGVRYHLFHSLGLLVLAINSRSTGFKWPWVMMFIGMLFFSVSIYLLSTRGLILAQGRARWLGPITPIGGLLLIISWISYGFMFLRSRS